MTRVEGEYPGNDLITVEVCFLTVEDARIAQGRLSAFNIASYVLETNDPYLIGRGVHLQVARNDLRTSRKILEKSETGEVVLGDDEMAEGTAEKLGVEMPIDIPMPPLTESESSALRREFYAALCLGVLPVILIRASYLLMHPTVIHLSRSENIAWAVANCSWIALVALFLHRRKASEVYPANLGFTFGPEQILHFLVVWFIADTLWWRVLGYPIMTVFQYLFGENVVLPMIVYAPFGTAVHLYGLIISPIWMILLILYIADTARRLNWSESFTTILLSTIIVADNLGQSPIALLGIVFFYVPLVFYYLNFKCGTAISGVIILRYYYIYLPWIRDHLL